MSNPFVPEEIQALIDQGALFFVNHSAGKDSQAMTIVLERIVPAAQLVYVHASLGDLEWPGVVEHIEATIAGPLFIVKAAATLLDLVERRGKWPSPQQRYCTSDLKRGPIAKFIRAFTKARGANLAVDCLGIRRQESKSRAKKSAVGPNKTLTTKSRKVFTWFPIFDLSVEQVFQTIRLAGQVPHWAYAQGSTRLSCLFCITGCRSDLSLAARQSPQILDRYARLEQKIGHTVFLKNGKPIPIREHIGLRPADVEGDEEARPRQEAWVC